MDIPIIHDENPTSPTQFVQNDKKKIIQVTNLRRLKTLLKIYALNVYTVRKKKSVSCICVKAQLFKVLQIYCKSQYFPS